MKRATMQIAADVIDGLRIAAVIDGRKLHMVYARPDDDRPWTGDVYAGKILRYAPAQRAYFLDIGADGGEVFMPRKDSKEFSPGQMIAVKIERPATREKGVRCSFDEETDRAAGLIARADDVTQTAQKDFPDAVLTDGDLEDFDAALVALREKTVAVQEGLEIVIEPTAAFVAIDVNNADPSLKPLEANILCVREIMRQMRLRNLTGQIIVDCLRLHTPEQRAAFTEAAAAAASQDPRRVDLYGFTKLGLFEMTRERGGLPLHELIAL